MKKGITPIISIIVLLLITVALAGSAWTFLQGFIFPQISKTFLVPSGGAYCTDGEIKVYILNTGYQSDLAAADFILHDIDETTVTLTGNVIPTGESGLILQDSGTGGWSKGYHVVNLGTNSQVQHINVYCPE